MSEREYVPEIVQYESEAQAECSKKNIDLRAALKGREQVHLENYGLSADNPIYTLNAAYTELYLKRICTYDGYGFTWQWRGSLKACCHGIENVPIDRYELFLYGKHYADLFFVMNLLPAKFPPAGLKYKDVHNDWKLEREAYAHGMDTWRYQEIKKMEEVQARATKKYVTSLKNRCEVILQKYPDFDFEKDYSNPLFKQLSGFRFDLVKIHEYINKDALLIKKQNETIGRTAENNNCREMLLEAELAARVVTSIPDDEGIISQMAADRGVTTEQMRSLLIMQIESEEKLWDKIQKDLDTNAMQVAEIKKIYPSFDPRIEYKNPLFVKMVRKMNMLVAYEMIHFDEIFISKKDLDSRKKEVINSKSRRIKKDEYVGTKIKKSSHVSKKKRIMLIIGIIISIIVFLSLAWVVLRSKDQKNIDLHLKRTCWEAETLKIAGESEYIILDEEMRGALSPGLLLKVKFHPIFDKVTLEFDDGKETFSYKIVDFDHVVIVDDIYNWDITFYDDVVLCVSNDYWSLFMKKVK